jgi:hypothetical protein
LEPNDHPELDESAELVVDNTVVYQALISSFQWAVSLGQIDMAVLVGTMSLFPVAPYQGHDLDRVKTNVWVPCCKEVHSNAHSYQQAQLFLCVSYYL